MRPSKRSSPRSKTRPKRTGTEPLALPRSVRYLPPMRGTIQLADTPRASPRERVTRLPLRPVPAPKTASRGLRPLAHHRLSRWRLQATDASGKMRPRYDLARRGAVLPQREGPGCDQRLLNLANGLADWGESFDSAGDKTLIAAGGVAVAGAAFGATGIGLPAGVTAEGVAGALAVGGTISKGVGSVLSVGSHALAITATGDWSYAGPAIFSGVAGILPFKLGPAASYFQDKVSGAASDMVGFGKIPQVCK